MNKLITAAIVYLIAMTPVAVAGPVPITYTPLVAECVAGTVVARSMSGMLQLLDPVNGLPLSCRDNRKLIKQLQDRIDELQVRMKKVTYRGTSGCFMCNTFLPQTPGD